MKIHLFDLPLNVIYTELNKGKILDKTKRLSNLGLSFPKYTLRRARRTKVIKLKYLKEIAELLKIKGRMVEKDVKSIFYRKNRKSSNKIYPEFPINFASKEGVRVISSLLFDGGINSHSIPFYSNTSTKMKKIVKRVFRTLFGENIAIYEDNSSLVFSKVIGVILVNSLGMKKGKKIKTNPDVPSFIFHLPKDVVSIFLRQAFSDEGSSSHGHQIKLELQGYPKNPPNLLIHLQKLLRLFGIKTSRILEGKIYERKDGTKTKGWYFTISHHSNLRKFIYNIGFDIKEKNTQIINYLSTLKEFPRMSKGKYEEYYFKKIKEIAKERFCYKDLMKISECSKSTAQHALKRLRGKNLIQLVSKGGPRDPYYYKLVNQYSRFS